MLVNLGLGFVLLVLALIYVIFIYLSLFNSAHISLMLCLEAYGGQQSRSVLQFFHYFIYITVF